MSMGPRNAATSARTATTTSVTGDPSEGNSGNNPAEKSDYRLEVDDAEQSEGLLSGRDQQRPPRGAFGLAGSGAGSLQMIDQVAQHPAVPVACYCVASILMTVVNKV